MKKASGRTGRIVRMSSSEETQYADRLKIPPRQVEFPEARSDSAVENASIPVFPTNVWRCDLHGSPG